MHKEALDERFKEALALQAECGDVGQDNSLYFTVRMQKTQHWFDHHGELGSRRRVKVELADGHDNLKMKQ